MSRQFRNIVSENILKTAYFALLHSNINFTVLAWGHSTHITEAFTVQRRCIRVMSGLSCRADCRNEFIRLKILTLPCQYILISRVYIKKNESAYETYSHGYGTRHRNNILPEFHRLKRSREVRGYYGISFFNHLPSNCKQLLLDKFKSVIKNYSQRMAFYSVREFLERSNNVGYDLEL